MTFGRSWKPTAISSSRLKNEKNADLKGLRFDFGSEEIREDRSNMHELNL